MNAHRIVVFANKSDVYLHCACGWRSTYEGGVELDELFVQAEGHIEEESVDADR